MRPAPGEIYAGARDLVLLPYRTGLAGRDHVLETYNDECSRAGTDGPVTYWPRPARHHLIVTTGGPPDPRWADQRQEGPGQGRR